MAQRLKIGSAVQLRWEPGTGGVIRRFDNGWAIISTPRGERKVPTEALRPVRKEHEVRIRRKAGLFGTSKKDYIAIGNILCRNGASPKLVEEMAGYFREDNPAFNPTRFVAHVAKCKR